MDNDLPPFEWDRDVIRIDTIADAECEDSANAGHFVRTFWAWRSNSADYVHARCRINGEDIIEAIPTENFCIWASQETEADHLLIVLNGRQIIVPKNYVSHVPAQIAAAKAG